MKRAVLSSSVVSSPVLLSWLGLLAALGCSTGESNFPSVARAYEPQPLPAHASESVRACYEHPDTQEYLERLHARVIDAWAVPARTPAHEIRAWIELDAAGNVPTVRILESPDEELAARIEAAIRQAVPFGPVPPPASCLLEEGLRARFATFRTGGSK